MTNFTVHVMLQAHAAAVLKDTIHTNTCLRCNHHLALMTMITSIAKRL